MYHAIAGVCKISIYSAYGVACDGWLKAFPGLEGDVRPINLAVAIQKASEGLKRGPEGGLGGVLEAGLEAGLEDDPA